MSRTEMLQLLTVEETANLTGLKQGSFYDPRIRARLKLPAVRVGKRVMFRVRDVAAMIDRGTEVLPTMPDKGRVDA